MMVIQKDARERDWGFMNVRSQRVSHSKRRMAKSCDGCWVLRARTKVYANSRAELLTKSQDNGSLGQKRARRTRDRGAPSCTCHARSETIGQHLDLFTPLQTSSCLKKPLLRGILANTSERRVRRRQRNERKCWAPTLVAPDVRSQVGNTPSHSLQLSSFWWLCLRLVVRVRSIEIRPGLRNSNSLSTCSRLGH